MSKDSRLGWRPDLPDRRDYRFKVSRTLDQLPASVDLSAVYHVPVVDQGQLGSCTGNGIASALSYLQAKEGMTPVYASRLFIYYNERVTEGTVASDAGANIRDGIKSVVDIGACPETDWPYDIGRFTERPPDLAYADAAKDLVKTYQKVAVNAIALMDALASGFAVVVGFTVYDSFMWSSDGNIPIPAPSEAVQGGHCVIVVGYDQATRRFKFQNSWGKGWGTSGFGTLPFDYLGSTDYGSDYWILTSDQSVTPNPPTPPTPPAPPPSGCLAVLGQILNVRTLKKAKALAKAEIDREK